MTFQSPMSLSLASALSTGQLFKQLPAHADLFASLSLSKVYNVMPFASVNMPLATLTPAGIDAVCAKADPTSDSANIADARTDIDRISPPECDSRRLGEQRSGARPPGARKVAQTRASQSGIAPARFPRGSASQVPGWS